MWSKVGAAPTCQQCPFFDPTKLDPSKSKAESPPAENFSENLEKFPAAQSPPRDGTEKIFRASIPYLGNFPELRTGEVPGLALCLLGRVYAIDNTHQRHTAGVAGGVPLVLDATGELRVLSWSGFRRACTISPRGGFSYPPPLVFLVGKFHSPAPPPYLKRVIWCSSGVFSVPAHLSQGL